MKGIRPLWAIAGLLFAGAASADLNVGDQYNMDLLLQGGPTSIRNAAKNVYNSGGAAPEVMDVLAETILSNLSQQDATSIDAMAWGCKALAQSGDKRYASVLETVANSDPAHRKLRKHCDKAAGQLGGPSGEQYAKGMVDLAKMKAKTSASASSPAAKPAAAAVTSGNFKPITEITEGMSMEQVYAIAGAPTSSGSHITGKSFIPFNFKGSDSVRTVARYKGQGRVIFSNTSAYTTSQKVLSVEIDLNESGFE